MSRFRSGAKYIGNYCHGRKDGHGKFYNVDGSYYDGNWTNEIKCGKGLYVYKNGDKYEGEWFRNQRHGRGRYYYKDTGIAATFSHSSGTDTRQC